MPSVQDIESQFIADDAQVSSNRPQVGSSNRPQVEAEEEVRAIEVKDHRTSSEQVESGTVQVSEQVESGTVQVSEQVESGTVQVSEQVNRLISFMSNKWQSASDLRKITNISHRQTFIKNYLNPALELGLIEMTQPDSPRSPTQKYRLTAKGKAFTRKLKKGKGQK